MEERKRKQPHIVCIMEDGKQLDSCVSFKFDLS
jgi:hypothetical protein